MFSLSTHSFLLFISSPSPAGVSFIILFLSVNPRHVQVKGCHLFNILILFFPLSLLFPSDYLAKGVISFLLFINISTSDTFFFPTLNYSCCLSSSFPIFLPSIPSIPTFVILFFAASSFTQLDEHWLNLSECHMEGGRERSRKMNRRLDRGIVKRHRLEMTNLISKLLLASSPLTFCACRPPSTSREVWRAPRAWLSFRSDCLLTLHFHLWFPPPLHLLSGLVSKSTGQVAKEGKYEKGSRTTGTQCPSTNMFRGTDTTGWNSEEGSRETREKVT